MIIPINAFLCPYRSLSLILYRFWGRFWLCDIETLTLWRSNIHISNYQLRFLRPDIYTYLLSDYWGHPQGHFWLEESTCIAYNGFVKLCSLASTKGFITRIGIPIHSFSSSVLYPSYGCGHVMLFDVSIFESMNQEKRRVKRLHTVRKKEGKIGNLHPLMVGERKEFVFFPLMCCFREGVPGDTFYLIYPSQWKSSSSSFAFYLALKY